jgi:flagellar basal body-associated protein FliL
LENNKMADDKEKEEQEPKTEPEEKKEPEAKEEEKPKAETEKASSFGLFTWLILGAIVMAGFAGGFALAQLLAGTDAEPAEQVEADGTTPEDAAINDLLVDKPQDEKLWPYDLEPVIANLDEPGVTRYARVTITLQLSPQMNQEKGSPFLEEKKPVLRDWLTTYIAGLNLERVRGTRNLARIKKEVRDSFNELLFPQSKPFINDILFKEFAVQ